MKSLVALLLLAAPASAGIWSRPDATTLKFEGDIEYDEYDRFAAVDSPQIKTLIVNSDGGVTASAIKIALVLASRDTRVVVTGRCLSSCANYFFVAGHSREIRGGVVGYHGNVQACFGSPEQREESKRRMKQKYGMSDEDIARNMDRQDREIADEARLLAMMGVSQGLFDRSCTRDKGVGDGKSYAFLLPKRATFEKYGLYGIVGEQDPSVMASLPFPCILD